MGDETGVQRSIKNNSAVNLLKNRKYWIWVLVVALIVGSVVLIQIDRRNNQKRKKAASGAKCSSAILEQAAADFDPNKINDLQKLTTQIQANPGYDKDVNCLFVVSTYYVDSSDADNAQVNLKKLKALDPGGNKLHVTDLYVGKTALDNLQSKVDYLQRQKTSQDGNLPDGAIPPGGLEKQ